MIRTPGSGEMRPRTALILAALTLATVAVYYRVPGFGFVQFDDFRYVAENPHVLRGLTVKGAAWALTTTHESNWHPLTWLSLMLDAQIGGTGPRLFHLTNVALHLANTLLLYYLFALLTGAAWRSAVVAALFAVHPLHVESVAWISERKDVLSTLFGILTLLAYTGYVRRRGTGRYLLVLLCFALGLMSKPMLVSLPLVLILLDIWPLGRVQVAAEGRPVSLRSIATALRPVLPEKIPLLLMSALSSIVTLYAQSAGGAVAPLEPFPLGQRAANAIVSYADYAIAMFWPSGLAIPYPYSTDRLTALRVAGSGLFLACGFILTLRFVRSRPFLAVGWLWYLITLVPVIGLVQVGTQARADRYTYVPLIGLFLMLAWGVPELVGLLTGSGRTHDQPSTVPGMKDHPASSARVQPAGAAQEREGSPAPHRPAAPSLTARGTPGMPGRIILTAAALATIAPLIVIAHRRAGLWRDGVLLFSETLAVTRQNAVAHNLLGLELFASGRIDESIDHCEEALRIRPGYVDAHINLAAGLVRKERNDEAARHCIEALRLRPDSGPAYACLGVALMRKNELEPAAEQFRQALRRAPDNASAHANLGLVLSRLGKYDEALVELREEQRLHPGLVQTHIDIAGVLTHKGDLAGAEAEFAAALRIEPNSFTAHNNLGVVLARQNRLEEAVSHFKQAVQIHPDDAGARNNLARIEALLDQKRGRGQ